MAPLNSNKRRSSTIAPLYRDPSPSEDSEASSSRRNTMTDNRPPSPNASFSSDKENQSAQQQADGNGKQRAMQESETLGSDGRANKRRRLEELNASATQNGDRGMKDFYDPNQDPDLKRRVRHGMRQNARELFDNREKYLESDNEVLRLIQNENEHFDQVRQTADAALDARFLVDVTDVVLQKNTRLLLGNDSVALNMDEFVSKCITFMRFGGPAREEDDDEPTATQARRRARARAQEEEDGDEGDALAWEYLGKKACYAHTRRPPAPSFLLGPLSVQKNQRTRTQKARLRRDTQAVATKPQELRAEDLERNEKSTLTHMCRMIRERLVEHCTNGNKQADIEADREIGVDVDEAEAETLYHGILKRHRIANNYAAPLFDFAVNPHSFGQTVENFFYISFLVKDGFVRLDFDKNHLPTITIRDPKEAKESHGRNRDSGRHQAILSIDYGTWEKLIKAYGIKEPLIPHREEEAQQVGTRSWYG